ncbi:AAA family ATPase [Neisseria perflava]|uniref:AAA family ATPase n=1 Tax=Neisseria perflava TaxID=33053 RepID=UPI00209DA991|nr:hypothetical protein [Neisseria perflava]
MNLGNVEKREGSLFFKKSDSDLTFTFNQLSSGEKEVVDIILDLFLRKDDYKGMIYLIDEPELHINTSIQRKLLSEINKLIDDEGQIWIATHSIGFMRAIQNEFSEISQVIKFYANLKYASEDIILQPMRMTRSNWQDIFSTALDDLTWLIAPKRIVYCEGKAIRSSSIEKGLDAQVLNNIFNEKYPDTIFVSSGGNTELDQCSDIAIAIIGKVFKDLEILVFKDRDVASGKPVSSQDRVEYLNNNPHNFRIMKRWEIENYLFDKEVIKNYCVQKNQSFDEAEYNKIIKDIKNADVKLLVSKMKKICGIATSINPEQFKINLSMYVTEDMNVYKELEECIFDRK